MKVLHLGYGHSIYDPRIMLKECVSLAKNGYEVAYFSSEKIDGAIDKTLYGVKLKTIPKRVKIKNISFILYLLDLYRLALKYNADVYHIHEATLLPVALKLKKRGKKVIYDSHENKTVEILGDYSIRYNKTIAKIVSILFGYYEVYVLKKLDIIITVANVVVDRFKEKGIKSIIIRNYPIIDELANIVKKDHKGINVCYIGGLTQTRGITKLVNSIAKTDAKLLLAGKYSSVQYEKEINSLQGYKQTQYYGYVDRKIIKEILSISDVGMATLLFVGQYNVADGLGIKVYEYMAASIPVIISDFPYAREILGSEKCGIFVDPENEDQIAKAINYISNNYNEATEMGINGRKAILNKYNWQSQEKILLDLYKSLDN